MHAASENSGLREQQRPRLPHQSVSHAPPPSQLSQQFSPSRSTLGGGGDGGGGGRGGGGGSEGGGGAGGGGAGGGGDGARNAAHGRRR